MTRKRYPTKAQAERLQILDTVTLSNIAAIIFLACGNAMKDLLVFYAPDMNEEARDKAAQRMIDEAVKIYTAEIQKENERAKLGQ